MGEAGQVERWGHGGIGQDAVIGDDGYPISPDWLRLTSVGIDVGSSTSHLMFSKLILQRKSEELSSQFVVVSRVILYRSPVLLTPYTDGTTIDTTMLSEFISHSYEQAGMNPEAVDSGAVICTGEAVRKHNAQAIVRMLAEKGGRFVSATAGPNLEAILCAYGSGAVARSREGRVVMNVDVGGGTSKIAICHDGRVVETTSINVGARLVAWDGSRRIVRIERTGREVCRDMGIDLQLGGVIPPEKVSSLADCLADHLMGALGWSPLTAQAEALMITPRLSFGKPVDEVFFSGGVAEYVYHLDNRQYGDMGPLLGAAIRARAEKEGIPLGPSAERIRATVIGASQYTVQVSSSTVYTSDENVLPIRDLQVVPVSLFDGDGYPTREQVTEEVIRALNRVDIGNGGLERPFAVALMESLVPHYQVVRAVAEGLAEALRFWKDRPWVLVLRSDLAGLVGSVLKEDLRIVPEVVVVDGIQVGALDYIDIGEKIQSAQALPVVVKSLVFG